MGCVRLGRDKRATTRRAVSMALRGGGRYNLRKRAKELDLMERNEQPQHSVCRLKLIKVEKSQHGGRPA